MNDQATSPKRPGIMNSEYRWPVVIALAAGAVNIFLYAFSLGSQLLRNVIQYVSVGVVATMFFAIVFRKK